MELLQTQVAGNFFQDWLIALVISFVVWIITVFIRHLLAKQFSRIAARTDMLFWPALVAVVRRTKWLFIFIFALYMGTFVLEMPDKIRQSINVFMIVALLIQSALWAVIGLQVAIDEYRQQQLAKDPASVTTLNVLNFMGKILIWAIVLLLVLDNLGVNITALIAGLGVGGVAVALALQTVLGDLFASLSIVLDKPFVVGDFLIVDELLGSVEYVGLKTTRVRSLSGEQLVFSNSDLLKSRIRNYGRMFERRVEFKIGVTYQTPREKLIMIPVIIREAIEQQEKTRFDRSHFKSYGDFALTFESVYYVLGPDYNQYMDIQQAINLKIHECFEEEGIEFAYPTQTLFVKQS
ncbi:MAG: mechanosensitive ion channel family protein [Gammaproteobacteria bacterium]|nr:mechanosensitive ion channel family protein [Gammaproteobacteria bacterium]MCW8988656.1 mechanosensitive ion channel family protein [Gammaproteobacteria bacterium]